MAEAIKSHPSRRLLQNLTSLSLTALGSILYHTLLTDRPKPETTWGKDVVLIFFGSRTGQTISLAIGMEVIHYFLIGFSTIYYKLTNIPSKKTK